MRYEQLNVGELTVDKIIGGGAFPNLGAGEKWYVDPTYGSNGNSGKTGNTALKTVIAGESVLRSGYNDTLLVLPGADAFSEAIVWDKSCAHLVGIAGHLPGYLPVAITDDGVAETTDYGTTFFSLTGSGCIIKNLRFDYGNALNTNLNFLRVEGNGNLLENVFFRGPMSTTLADLETYDHVIVGGIGNVFRDAIFGTMWKTRSVGNNLLKFQRSTGAVAARHTIFERCLFQSNVDNVAVTHIDVNSEGGGGYGPQYFKACTLYFRWSDHGDQVTQAIRWGSGGLTATLHFDVDCTVWGADDVTVGTVARQGIIWAQAGATTSTLGLSLNTA